MARLIDADKSTEILRRLLYETALNNSGEASMMCEDIAENRLKTWIDLIPTEAEPIEFEWCHDCKEYDNNAHCCHRWTKVIRNTVDDLKTQGYEIVREGHWILNEWGDFTCEFCDNAPPYNSDVYNMNYCPNCGAKLTLDIKRFERYENG